jgi:exodeoxyribonuclease VII large subunit
MDSRKTSSSFDIGRKTYTISELTREIKTLFENQYPLLWITGEISNLYRAASGHYYLNLKDEAAQIAAVMFKGQNRVLKFKPENGQLVTGMGRISVYEPRGTYQIILEYLEPSGIGAIQLAYEQLKIKLSQEGLFDEKHKQKLPFLPQKISIVTSSGGAVVHDFINILFRRYSNMHLEIVPVSVQGRHAVQEIVSAIHLVNRRSAAVKTSDIAVLARGGGSIEDLAAFNHEDVARAIFESRIPIVSAIGHETDFTIADFAADLRAPTPSAAAELVVPVKDDLALHILERRRSLQSKMFRRMGELTAKLNHITSRLTDPGKKVEALHLRTDHLTMRLAIVLKNMVHLTKARLTWSKNGILNNNPSKLIDKNKQKLELLNNNLSTSLKIYIQQQRFSLEKLTEKLHSFNPTAILTRGYSITRTIPDGLIIRDSRLVEVGQKVNVLLSNGDLTCRIERKNDNADTDV